VRRSPAVAGDRQQAAPNAILASFFAFPQEADNMASNHSAVVAADRASGGLGLAIYGAGPRTVFLGFLLVVAGIPVHVWIKWRNARAGALRSQPREV
jgi:hypothetical protein